ncbi:threonine synthase [Halorubrum californiense DSM 19288]|uniref:Threonine synthase n=1 Tax=Halorubrum californiense DSM 19288 TaxID=1227465 RepID=M0E979_9EURY|nr:MULTISPECIES: pyridoxal-phosphate dependent enzyme [Halorubrum]ELZ44361.1 threonine synthase [Halorubrum californiense DSM 19288]TKX68898.1 pyridoxal-phosphate dependent enzyme [Halorubrum sp. GN11GM_10-3_MGM]
MDRLVCYDCGETAAGGAARCACGEPLWFDTDGGAFSWPDASGGDNDDADDGVRLGRDSLWRYESVLPASVPTGFAAAAGGTPLFRAPSIEPPDGPGIHLKVEGTNPTGSFKDRGTAVGIGRLDGPVGTVSHGNMALSVAAHAAAAGREAVILVAEDTPDSRLAMIAQHDPHLFRVRGEYGKLYEDALERDLGVAFLNSDAPLRVAGQKTVAYEICEAFAPDAPDAILLPVSSGGQASGVWKALRELDAAGLLPSVPRIYLAQAARCDPIARAYRRGDSRVEAVEGEPTAAVSINNADPPSGNRALAAARATDGGVVSVSEESMLAETDRLAADAGVSVEPSCAVATAAVRDLAASGEFGPEDDVAVILTGSGYKYGPSEVDASSVREVDRTDVPDAVREVVP